MMRLPALVAVFAALAPSVAAQRSAAPAHSSAAAHSAPARFNSRGSNFAFGRNPRSSAFRRSSPYLSPYTSLPFAFFGGSFDSDDIYSSGYPVASEPPPYLMQAMRDMAAPGSGGEGASPLSHHEPSSSQPLVIELQNGRYVRVNSIAVNGDALPLAFATPAKSTGIASPQVAQPLSTPEATAPSTIDLAPAVLVFRDGHNEEVRDYTIADGSLYARGDFYTDGYWNKKIDLASLNVAETMQANASRKVKFILPSSPNEVITRP